MTLHTAKGLEFPVVFLTGMEHGLFPHQRALTDEKEMSEERRLAYVGLTRAMERLYLTRSETRTMWGKSQFNPPSPFLEEIPEELIEWKRTAGFSGFGGLRHGCVRRSRRQFLWRKLLRWWLRQRLLRRFALRIQLRLRFRRLLGWLRLRQL